MPTLAYTARTLTGEVVEGKLRAHDEYDARNTLSARGLELLELAEIQRGATQTGANPFGALFRPVAMPVLAALTGQLALMLRTGTALMESLDALAEQAHNERLRNIIEDIRNRISGGATLTDALAAHPRVFEPYYVSAVRAGEASGTLVEVFDRLKDYLEKQVEIRNRIVTALIYPAIITVLAIGAVTFILTFVLPRFIVVFERAGVALPVPTQILMALSYSVVTYWYIWLLSLAGSATAMYLFARSSSGKRTFDYLMLRLPVLGPLTSTIQVSALLRTLGTLLDAGVPLVQSLEVAREACKNGLFREFADDLISRVVSGGDMASLVRHHPLLTPAIQQMIITGERTGSLAEVMSAVAKHLDEEADKRIKRVMALFEPAVLIGMGVMIGFIAVSVLLPLFRLTAAARGAG